VSFAQTIILGALAGFTIYLGLPLGRLKLLGTRSRVAFAMFAVGVLAFLFVDILSDALGTLKETMVAVKAGREEVGELASFVVLLAGGFVAGSAGLGLLERRMRPRKDTHLPAAGGSGEALAVEHAAELDQHAENTRRHALQTAMTIAAAIGAHNFSEGLAIGVSARSGAIGLATVLIVGFALHNATEGFGIVGPLAGIRLSWRWLALAGLVGGGPTFVGTIVGYNVKSEPLELVFYAVAAGAILYVIGEVWHGMRRYGHRELGLLMVATGFLVGLLTNLVVVYGGAGS
jgi:ZIP family zinc transporter